MSGKIVNNKYRIVPNIIMRDIYYNNDGKNKSNTLLLYIDLRDEEDTKEIIPKINELQNIGVSTVVIPVHGLLNPKLRISTCSTCIKEIVGRENIVKSLDKFKTSLL